MKKYCCILLAGLLFSLTACGRKMEEPVEAGGIPEQTEAEIIDDDLFSDALGEQDMEQSAGEMGEEPGEAVSGETISEETVSEETILESDTVEPKEPQTSYYMMENPGWEYYLTDSILSEDDIELELEQLTEEANEIIDTEKWFVGNGLERPSRFSMEDDTYRYEISGDDGYLLDLYRKDTGEHLYCLDFSAYRYADDFKEEDRVYVEQSIWWAQSVEDTLYVAVGHNTYAESSPHTGYLIAVDLNDMSVIWKSEPCTTNSQNFEIVDNTILCGYGFTSEPDHLILVNRLDGTQIEKIPLKTAPEYIICKDDVLYVRTYNTDYTFRMYRVVSCH